MKAPNLFHEISATDEDSIRGAHEWAIACGVVLTQREELVEREASSRLLTCMAIEHLLEAAVTVEAFQSQAAIVGDPASFVFEGGLRQLRDASGGAARLLSAALEADARDVGYDIDVWTQRAIRTTASIVRARDSDLPRPTATEVSRAALLDVSAALEGGERDRMVVPGYLASAIGCNTAMFMLACELLARVRA